MKISNKLMSYFKLTFITCPQISKELPFVIKLAKSSNGGLVLGSPDSNRI